MPEDEFPEASSDSTDSLVSEVLTRDTGIALIGDAPWATHLCQFYETREDLLDVVVPYLKAGLEHDEKCVWVTSDPISVDIARGALAATVPDFANYEKRGQIEMVPHTEWYLKDGIFDFHRVLNDWQAKHDEALADGYEGIRVTGNTAWLEREDWAAFNQYEHAINDAIRDGKILVLCTYSLDKCSSTEILDVISSHEYALVKREGDWELVESVDQKDLRHAMEQKEQEATEAIRESEARYHSLFNNMIDGFALHRIVLDDTGRPVDYEFLEVNKAFEEMTGLKGQDIVGKGVREAIPGIEDDPADWIGTYGKVALEGTEVRFEQHAESLGRWYSVAAYSPARGYFATIFEDISEHKKAHAAVLQANEDWQQLFDSVPDLLSVIDRDHRIKRANRAMAARLGLSQEECVGLFCYEGVHGTKEPVDGCPHTLTCDDGEEHTAEIYEPRLKGHFLVTTTPFHDSNGEFQGSLHVARDITERKKAEGALRQIMEESVRASRYSDALNRINALMNTTLDFQRSIEHAVDQSVEVTDADSSFVVIHNDENWAIQANRNLKLDIGDVIGDELVSGLELPSGKGDTVTVSEDGETYAANRELLSALGIRAGIFAPLTSKGELSGLLGIGYAGNVKAFAQSEVDFVRKLANSLSLSLENARLFEMEQVARADVQSFATRLSILHEIGLSLNRETDRDKLLSAIMSAAVHMTSAGVGALLLMEDGESTLVALEQAEWYSDRCSIEEDASRLHKRISRFMVDRDRNVVLVPDFRDGYSGRKLPEGHLYLRGLLIGALRDTRGRNRGYIVLSDKAGGSDFTNEDREIISLLATQSSVALTSIENLELEHTVAEMLQSSLLPPPPEREDMDVGLLYRSAGKSARVGGDYYDFIELGDNRFAIVVADVCGKGLDAAAYTAMVKYMLHAYLREDADPGSCLTRLNRSLAGDLDPDKFVTLSLAVIDNTRQILNYAIAGHPAPFISGNGSLSELKSPNTMPLGVLADYQFQTRELPLPVNTSVLMFTDGLIESRLPGGDQFGYDKLRKLFADNCSLPAQALAQTLMQRVVDFSEGRLADDVALIVVKLNHEV